MAVDIKRLIKEAAEAAKQVPEHLQEAAFNKAFDALQAADTTPASPKRSPTHSKKKTLTAPASAPSADLDALDRTAHPEVVHSASALDNSLRVLRAAKDDLDIDGLSASTIAAVLSGKFRCGVTRAAVSMALNRAGRYVNRHTEGSQVIFRLMAPGEEYLDTPQDSNTPGPAKRRRKTKAPSAPKKKASAKPVETKASPKNKKTRASGRVGAMKAMGQLYDAGFFKSSQTIAAAIERMRHDMGRSFKPNELSPVLLRWLRSGKLSRTKNADNQYEYKQ